MSSIFFNKGERVFLDGILNGSGAAAAYDITAVQHMPAPAGNWGVGLGTSTVAELTKASDIGDIVEIGSSSPAGYDRFSMVRNSTDWPSSAVVSGSAQSSAATQASFTFSGAPVPNAANMWFFAGSDVISADNALYGADLATENTYADLSVQLVDVSFRLS